MEGWKSKQTVAARAKTDRERKRERECVCVSVCVRQTERKSRQEEEGDIKGGRKRGPGGKRQDKGTQIKKERWLSRS